MAPAVPAAEYFDIDIDSDVSSDDIEGAIDEDDDIPDARFKTNEKGEYFIREADGSVQTKRDGRLTGPFGKPGASPPKDVFDGCMTLLNHEETIGCLNST